MSRGELPVGVDAPIHATWEGTITGDGDPKVIKVGAAGLNSTSDRTPAGPIVNWKVVVKSSGSVVARIREIDAWDGASKDGSHLVYARGFQEEARRGVGTRIDAFTVAGYADDSAGAARADIEVLITASFRGAD